ncbi:MAG: hypothetical protein WAW86_09275 [Gammaproteobacteria bacterium]
MFNEETLFILGAGASWYYGYPLGKDLIHSIIQAITSEQIYVPLTREQEAMVSSNTDLLNKMQFSLHYVSEQLKNIDIKNIPDGNNQFLRINSNHVLANMRQTGVFPTSSVLASVKLSQIKEFATLKNALKQFDPVSIDVFLNNHQSHALAGKAMIIYALLKCEDPSAFGIGYKRKPESWKASQSYIVEDDNWYSYLLADIMSGCVKPDDIVNNNLNIITFNYDMSLDYILYKKLSNVEMFKDDGIAKNYIDDLVLNKIHHVYGKLYNESSQEVYGFHQLKPSNVDAKTNAIRLFQAISSSELIKLIKDRLLAHKDGFYKSLIEQARKIIIIGFGFDRDNLDVLGFPSRPEGYNEMFKGKELLYMDYDGRMRGLAEQFGYLTKKFDFRASRSAATRITDAYQNDFKIRLFQEIT